MITVVTMDGRHHLFREALSEEDLATVQTAVITGQGFTLEDIDRSISYAPAGVARVVIDK